MRTLCKIASWADSEVQVSLYYLRNYPDILKTDKNISMIDISKEAETVQYLLMKVFLNKNIGIYQIYSKVMTPHQDAIPLI